MLLVAGETYTHGCDAGRFGHPVHLRDLPVAHLAFHSSLQVFTMRPCNARENLVDAHPRDWLTGFGKRREFLDRGLVRGDRNMARHACAGGRKRHHVSGSWIGVTSRTGQAKCQMVFMAVGDRLFRRRVFDRVIGNFLFHFRGCIRLLGPGVRRQAKRHREKCGVQGHNYHSRDPFQNPTSRVACRVQIENEVRSAFFYDDLFSFLPTTSSMLVPRSFSMTMAALRPGWPVTEPPGAVVPPV
jgi:hypothetical protein